MSDRWIEIQRRYFERFAGGPFKMYAFVNGVEKDYSHLFDFYSTEPIECCVGGNNHCKKLNILADVIASSTGQNDVMVFIDGDAFPIAHLSTYIVKHLKRYPLIAARRDENLGDRQPHPCFAATTVKFWKKIKGDWCQGYKWRDSTGQYVTDTGGNLLRYLEEKDLVWMPVLRSNKVNPHPVWFAVYGGVVYHHGAGFRGKIQRVDQVDIDKRFPFRARIKRWQNSDTSWFLKNVGYVFNAFYNNSNYEAAVMQARGRNKELMDEVFAELSVNESFWHRFV